MFFPALHIFLAGIFNYLVVLVCPHGRVVLEPICCGVVGYLRSIVFLVCVDNLFLLFASTEACIYSYSSVWTNYFNVVGSIAWSVYVRCHPFQYVDHYSAFNADIAWMFHRWPSC